MGAFTGKYALGVDFGSLSARAVVADVRDGTELAFAESKYEHGVMTDVIPGGVRLGSDWALQHPADYIKALVGCVREAIKISGVRAEDIIGVGVDFTSCTFLPVTAEGVPLCFTDGFAKEPHAYVKMWKHHAAQSYADCLGRIATERGEKFMSRYGGKVSSEWYIPKIMQIVTECPAVYDAASYFTEAGDWIVAWLTGKVTRSESMAAYKCFYDKKSGYPSTEFFRALNPRLADFTEKKLKGAILPPGTLAGKVGLKAAIETGLCAGTPVAVANIDAHVCMAAMGRPQPDSMATVIGTSAADIILSDKYRDIPGICGVAEDGTLPGFYSYEAGQSCVGDHFEWFVANAVPADVTSEADGRGVSVHTVLCERAARKAIGESGLIALDWWNGNRSVLTDASLSGMIVGLTLGTKPEDIYRALIESTAFGAKVIIDNFENNGVPVNKIYATGGIAEKNELLMSIYASVTGKEYRILRSGSGAALGSAVFGAGVAGSAAGGYDSVGEASAAMGGVKDKVFRPDKRSVDAYGRLFALYKRLHDGFGIDNDFMSELRALKNINA